MPARDREVRLRAIRRLTAERHERDSAASGTRRRGGKKKNGPKNGPSGSRNRAK